MPKESYTPRVVLVGPPWIQGRVEGSQAVKHLLDLLQRGTPQMHVFICGDKGGRVKTGEKRVGNTAPAAVPSSSPLVSPHLGGGNIGRTSEATGALCFSGTHGVTGAHLVFLQVHAARKHTGQRLAMPDRLFTPGVWAAWKHTDQRMAMPDCPFTPAYGPHGSTQARDWPCLTVRSHQVAAGLSYS